MRVDFQVIHTFESVDKLNNTFDEILKASNESFLADYNVDYFDGLFLEIKYNKQINNYSIAGFSLIVNDCDFINDYDHDVKVGFDWGAKESIQRMDEIIHAFIDFLNEEHNIILITKFFDLNRLNEYALYSQEIFTIEMKLREVISFIFLDSYDDKFFNLTEEYNINTGLWKNLKEEDLTKNLENEFFYMLFSDYSKLESSNLKEINHKLFINYLQENDTFEDLQMQILSRGIKRDKYKSFLAKIKVHLEVIESFRNCIAHNRKISNRLLSAFPENKENLLTAIDEFWIDLPDYLENREQEQLQRE